MLLRMAGSAGIAITALNTGLNPIVLCPLSVLSAVTFSVIPSMVLATFVLVVMIAVHLRILVVR